MDQDPAAFDMFTYLTGNSTSDEINGNAETNVSKINEYKSLNVSSKNPYCFSELPIDCGEWFNKGEANSGIYVIKPNLSEPFNVYCEMSSG